MTIVLHAPPEVSELNDEVKAAETRALAPAAKCQLAIIRDDEVVVDGGIGKHVNDGFALIRGGSR
jgi:hypothetical protein